MSDLLNRFRDVILSASEADIHRDVTLRGQLVIASERTLTVSYAPFEHIQIGARIVIAGITPGAQQAANALAEIRRQILMGKTDAEALATAKLQASFSGSLRRGLVRMLDEVGVNRYLGIGTCASLWAGDSRLAHFTSVLRNPVFREGKNYRGSPSMTRTRLLRECLDEWLAEEASVLSDAIWVSCGPVAAEGLSQMVQDGILDDDQVLIGMPHPSGANNERIACFLGNVRERGPSEKTDVAKIVAGRNAMISKLKRLSEGPRSVALT